MMANRLLIIPINEGLSSNYIFCILEDKLGNIWFHTEDGGACKFDGTVFTNYNTETGLSENNVLCMRPRR